MEVPPENSVPSVSAEPVVTRLVTMPAMDKTMRMAEMMKPYFHIPTKLNCLWGLSEYMLLHLLSRRDASRAACLSLHALALGGVFPLLRGNELV